MPEFDVHISDPYTGKKQEHLPETFEVVVQRRWSGNEPNVLRVVTEPLSDFLARNKVEPGPCD